MQIGELIKQLRSERDWPLSMLSTATGISKGYLSELEHGNADPSLSILQQLAKGFGMGAADLLALAGYTNDVNKMRGAYVTGYKAALLHIQRDWRDRLFDQVQTSMEVAEELAAKLFP